MAQIHMTPVGRGKQIRPGKYERVLVDGRPWNYGPQEAIFSEDRMWAYNPRDRMWAYRSGGLGAVLDHPFWGPAVVVGGIAALVIGAAWFMTPPAGRTARGRLYQERQGSY